MTDKDINHIINYTDIIGNWLTIKILIFISDKKQLIELKNLKVITDLIDFDYYKTKVELLKFHDLVNKHNMIS